MGNVNGREEGQNGGDDPSRGTSAVSCFRNDLQEKLNGRDRSAFMELVGNTPPEIPAGSQSPPLFIPQVISISIFSWFSLFGAVVFVFPYYYLIYLSFLQ